MQKTRTEKGMKWVTVEAGNQRFSSTVCEIQRNSQIAKKLKKLKSLNRVSTSYHIGKGWL